MGGTAGWFLQLVVAYTVVSIPDALNDPVGQPFAGYLIQILPRQTALAVLSLTIIAGFAMGQGCMIGKFLERKCETLLQIPPSGGLVVGETRQEKIVLDIVQHSSLMLPTHVERIRADIR